MCANSFIYKLLDFNLYLVSNKTTLISCSNYTFKSQISQIANIYQRMPISCSLRSVLGEDSLLSVLATHVPVCVPGAGTRPGEVCGGSVSPSCPAVKCVRVYVGVCVQEKQADTHIPEKHSGGEHRADHQQQTAVITFMENSVISVLASSFVSWLTVG